jgi:hypothetical protein
MLQPRLSQVTCRAFFGEVTPELQVAFAHLFGITTELVAAAKAFALYSGESYPLAE